jgi:membrane-associated phospholipid phosphatase
VGLHLVVLSGVYALALGTRGGVVLDSRAILDAHTMRPWAAHWIVSDALHAVAAASFALMAAAVIAMRRRDTPALLLAALLVVGATATAQLLKPALGELGIFDAESTHELDRTFPSGHAATTLALGLALVHAVPSGWRWAAAAFAVTCSTAVGIGVLMLGWHYPSDEVGGFLIAGAWSAATSSRTAAGRPPPGGHGDARGRPGVAVLSTLGLAAAGCLALPIVAFAHLVEGRTAPPAFAAGAATIAAVAIVVTAEKVRPLGFRRRSTGSSSRW